METTEQYTVKTPEDEFNEIIDRIETRAMACDGPVTPTLQEATEEELSRLWELVNEISPKRKAIARRILQGKETDQDTNDYLKANGLDPDVVGKTGALFVKAVSENLRLKNPWIKSSDKMPEYNVAVLVFIPDEDNHITVGMWDISKKWVLLDEYRLPLSTVTYWAPLIDEPKDKEYTPCRPRDKDQDTTTWTIRTLQKENFELIKENERLRGTIGELREVLTKAVDATDMVPSIRLKCKSVLLKFQPKKDESHDEPIKER